jgi:lysophospholipase L1-like esterase
MALQFRISHGGQHAEETGTGESTMSLCVLRVMLACLLTASVARAADDVVIYGGTSAGVIAAIEASRLGKSVTLIEPTQHLGGLTTGGLGMTDVGKPQAVGGLAHEFYHRLWLYYQQPDAWTAQTKDSYKNAMGQGVRAMDDTEQAMWTFEPHAAEEVFESWLNETGVHVVRGERLDLKAGIVKEKTRITELKMESGKTFPAKMFIDASYEGDLMPQAGVSYTVGREANSQYGETLDGIEAIKAVKNQLVAGIDAYIKPGDTTSGLLPGVNHDTGGTDGTADHKIQAYCYRMCLTTDPANSVAIEKPAGYRELDYEILLRSIELGAKSGFFKADMMPNRKTDSNNSGGISTDFIGRNYDYPDGDYTTRDAICKAQENWQRGLLWTLQNSPRVPAAIRRQYARFGLPKDEFPDSNHWARQLYVREARRMVGELVETEGLLRNDHAIEKSIGLGSYQLDSHNCQRYVDSQGHVRNEGDVEIGVPHPYQIDYQAITPKASQCTNLVVPVCLSASHVAYGSIRMEPVFMVLGQSAGAAAALAIDANVPVQQVPYHSLRGQLLAEHQVLTWPVVAETAQVACLGDSITARGYSEALSKLIGVSVANAGAPGDSSKQGLARLSEDVLARKPQVVVVMFGTDDSRLDDEKVHVTPQAFAGNLTAIVKACEAANIKVVLCTLPPIEEAKYFTRHDRAKFNAAGGLPHVLDEYREAALNVGNELHIPVVDLNHSLASDPHWKTDDGVHPTADASCLIAQRIQPVIQPLLSQRKSN